MDSRAEMHGRAGNRGKRPRRLSPLLVSLLAGITLLLAFAPSASALSIGVLWRNYDPAEIDSVQSSGATVYRIPIDMTQSKGGTDWATTYDPIFQSAWEHHITILPGLTRSTIESGHVLTRFLTSSDTEWSSWYSFARKAVKRYGVGGEFWAGKENPYPVTAWEIWNEPNLARNNPVLSEAKCKEIGQAFHSGEANTCIQPRNYGNFLVYTSNAVRQGQEEANGGSTTVLFGSLYMETGGESYSTYLPTAYEATGVYNSYNGLAIHPYSFTGKVAGMAEKISGVRAALNERPWGPSRSLWITELGWPVAGSGVSTVSEAEQASLLTESFNWIKSEAASKNIQLVTWYNLRDPGGSTWDGYCGLRDGNGNYRPAWYALLAQTGAEVPDPAVAVISSGELNVKAGSLGGSWVNESISGVSIESVSIATDPGTGPIIGVVASNHHAYVKRGLYGEWVDETAGAESISVATNFANGPLVAVRTNDGHGRVKQGLYGEWVDVTGGAVKSISVASDYVHGPLIGVVDGEGHAKVKQGSLYAEWVDITGGPVKSLSLATDSINGPLIGVMTTEDHALVKQGSIYASWVDETGGPVKSLSLATDSINGPLIGVLSGEGHALVKQGSIYASWVDETGGAVSALGLASNRLHGPLVGVLTGDGHALVKGGSIYGEWVNESAGVQSFSVAG